MKAKGILPVHLNDEESAAMDAVLGTNPGFSTHDPEYTENCQRCVVAYEARRRGFDAIAKPILFDRPDALPYIVDEVGWPAVFTDHKVEYCHADSAEQAKWKVEALMRKYGESSRAIVKVDWIGQHKGHLFIAENSHGTVYYVDPQTGALDVSWYFFFASPHSVAVMRIDNKEFTELDTRCIE